MVTTNSLHSLYVVSATNILIVGFSTPCDLNFAGRFFSLRFCNQVAKKIMYICSLL